MGSAGPSALCAMTPSTPKKMRKRASSAAARDAFRREAFAQLAQSPMHAALGVEVEAIERRLAEAHRCARRRWPTLRPAALHLRDAALATACVARRPGAWQALVAEHEHALIVAAMWVLDEEQAIITVRRLLVDLRKSVAADRRKPAMGLRLYRADRPLRDWLLERLTGRIAVGAIAPSGQGRAREARVLGRVRQAGRAGLHVGRARARRPRADEGDEAPPPAALPFPIAAAGGASPAATALPWVAGGESAIAFDREGPAPSRRRSV